MFCLTLSFTPFFFYLICPKWASLSTLEIESFNLKPKFSQKPEEQTLVEKIPFDSKPPQAQRGTEGQNHPTAAARLPSSLEAQMPLGHRSDPGHPSVKLHRAALVVNQCFTGQGHLPSALPAAPRQVAFPSCPSFLAMCTDLEGLPLGRYACAAGAAAVGRPLSPRCGRLHRSPGPRSAPATRGQCLC